MMAPGPPSGVSGWRETVQKAFWRVGTESRSCYHDPFDALRR